jgi:hypothetical protein
MRHLWLLSSVVTKRLFIEQKFIKGPALTQGQKKHIWQVEDGNEHFTGKAWIMSNMMFVRGAILFCLFLIMNSLPAFAFRTHETSNNIVNLTGGAMRLISASHDKHSYWVCNASGLITNSGVGSCSVATDQWFRGCDNTMVYGLERGGSVTLYADNTFSSGNHFKYGINGVPPMVDPGTGTTTPLHVNVYGATHGNFITVVWIVSWTDLAQDANGLDWNTIQQKLNETQQQLNRETPPPR